jgi:phosphatidylglycerophosphate synthase
MVHYIPNRYSHLDRLQIKLSYPILIALKHLKICPSTITLIGVMVRGCETYIHFQNKFLLSMILESIHHWLDNLDGSYARFSNQTTTRGGWLDAKSDAVSGCICCILFILNINKYLFSKNSIFHLIFFNIIYIIHWLLVDKFWNKYDPTIFGHFFIFLFLYKFKIGSF